MIKSLLKIFRFKAFLFVFLLGYTHLYAQSEWVVLGEESQIATAASNYTSIVTIEENDVVVPYVAFTEAGIPKVKKHVNGLWIQVGTNVSATNASYLTLAVDGNHKLYVQYIDLSAGNKLAVRVYDANSNSWIAAANNLHASTGSAITEQTDERVPYNNAISFDSQNVPYVAFGEFSSGGYAWIKKLENGEWTTVGNGSLNNVDRANTIDIDFTSNDIPYVVFHENTTAGKIKAFRFLNSVWEDLNVPETFTTGARTTRLAIDKLTNKVFLNYSNAVSGTVANAILYENGAWKALGGRIGSGSAATYTSTITDKKGNLYALFRDQMSNSNGTYRARLNEFVAGSKFWSEVGTGGGFDGPVNGYTSLAIGSDNNMYLVYLKTNSSSISTPVVKVLKQQAKAPADIAVNTPKQMEYLDRGLVAIKDGNKIFLSWRLLGTDPSTISFNLYRNGIKINSQPISTSTNYIDNTVTDGTYSVRAIVNNVEQPPSVSATIWDKNFLNIPLQIPAGGTTPDNVTYTYLANDCSVGDLDGDGIYEVILKWEPTNASDNSSGSYTGNTILDAYKLDGTRLWRIDLGRNIRSGAHYTPFTVYDLDGDGKAELAIRTADGTKDGLGNYIGDANADYRSTQGTILTGPEYLTIFNGESGAAMQSVDYYPERGVVSSWGDDYGNRVDRFVDAVAYLDGERPSLVTGRGYYTRLVRVAWDWRNGTLTRRWVFDSSTLGNSGYFGQGNHQMTIGDVDGDGKDEVINGSSVINDNGEGLWTDGKGHGDALHMTDMDPDLPGQEIWMCHEDESSYVNYGLTFRNAKTGETLFGVETTGDIGRAMAADIDPRYKGYEVWGPRGGLYSAKGVQISTARPTTMNFGVWWDGDLQREFLDNVTISKWNHLNSTTNVLLNDQGISSNNSTKATPNLSADIFGDWREEVIWRTSDNTALRIYTTTIPTEHRIPTLMHDAQYRTAVAWQNSAYNQPPYPSFYLGSDMDVVSSLNINPIVINQTPQKPTISPANLVICEGGDAKLTSSSVIGNQWYKDQVLIEGAVFSTYFPTETGIYSVKVAEMSNSVNVSFTQTPIATITAEGSTTFLNGSNVVLTANAGSGYSYKWFKNSVEIENATQIEYIAASSGEYKVQVSSNRCLATSQPINVSSIFNLPINNFRVSSTAETCRASNNGKINVVATDQTYTYSAILKQGNSSTSYNFTNNTLDINNLSAGTYELCVYVNNYADYKQCFNIIITEPQELAIYTTLNNATNDIVIKLAGADIYHVELNGLVYTTKENEITLGLIADQTNTLKVSTDVICQGEIKEVFDLSTNHQVYPNPFIDVLNVSLNEDDPEFVKVEVRSLDGKEVYNKRHSSNSGVLKLQLAHLQTGVYILKLDFGNSIKSFKIIKK